MVKSSVFKWLTIWKPNFQNGCSSLDCFTYKNKNNFSLYIKWPRLTIVRIWNGPDHSKTEQMAAILSKTIQNILVFGIRAPTVPDKCPEIGLCNIFYIPNKFVFNSGLDPINKKSWIRKIFWKFWRLVHITEIKSPNFG